MGKNKKSSGQKDLKKRNAQLQAEVNMLRQQVEVLTSQLAQIQRMMFGRRSEKISSDQLALFAGHRSELPAEDAEISEDTEDSNPEDDSNGPDNQKKKKPITHPGRHPLPDNLEREDIHLHPDNLDCKCCGEQMEPAGVEISEKLSSRQSFFVKCFHRHKYACRHCEDDMIRPDFPGDANDKSLATTDVHARVAVSKYLDHIPLYRQEAMFRREGIILKRQTLCSWMSRHAYNLQPVVAQMAKEMLAGEFIQSDDTGLKYLESPGPANQGYMWSYVSGKMVVYDFTTDRSRVGPSEFLSGFTGALQVDGYYGYNQAVEKGGLTRAACWAHARRKFEYALKTEEVMSAEILLLIQKLYRVERDIRGQDPVLTPDQIVVVRKNRSLALIAELKKYLLECRQAVLPKSPLGKAIEYAFGQWEWLETYIHNGLVDIDNNSCERSMRKVAIGRKNYMFAGSETGGHAAAVFYSLLETCSRLGINSQEYLADVMVRVNTHPQSRVEELTPHGWKAKRESEEELIA